MDDAMNEPASVEEYPGINFRPPAGTVEPDATEGEEMVTWKKIDGEYTITEFGGKAVGNETPAAEMTFDEEVDQIAAQ